MKKATKTAKNQPTNSEPDEKCSVITFAQQKNILKVIKNTKYYNFFYFCCCTGVRVCEALLIKQKDIDHNKHHIKIKITEPQTKKHKREIPFIPELFDNFTLTKPNNYLFEDITEDGSKQFFYNLYKDLNYDLCRHSTRHTFVSICMFVGVDPQIIQNWVAHTNLKMTTDTYTHSLRKGTSPILTYIRKLKNSIK